MNILITGAAGFIGSRLTKYLANHTNHNIIGIDRLDIPNFSGTKFTQMDLEDDVRLEELFRRENVDTVIHLANIVEPELSAANPLACYKNNVANTIGLLEHCVRRKVPRFLFLSSAAVYSVINHGSMDEKASLGPWGVYGRSKLMCEQILTDTSKTEPSLSYLIIRCPEVVGGDNSSQNFSAVTSRLHPIRIAAQAALGIRDAMVIFGDDFDTRDGTCIRDYVHVEDVVIMVSVALEYLDRSGDSRVFNCGSGIGHTLREVAETMRVASGHNFEIKVGERRDHENPSILLDISTAQTVLGWSPFHTSLDSLCRETLDLEKARIPRP